jgi:hypothetical protein
MTRTNDEKRILVIYYIEMRTRYFNKFANIIFRQLIKEEHPILSHNKEIIKNIENIVAKSGSSHWSYRNRKSNYTIGKIFGYEIKFIPNEKLDLLIEQADRMKTKSTVLGSDFPILASEKRLGLFPDDGLFNMFEKLTNKDIRAKIKVENERIKSFLTNIREISNVSLSLNGGVRIVPEPTVSDTSGASVVSLELKDDITKIYEYSQEDLILFLTDTDAAIKDINKIISSSIDDIISLRDDYIKKMRIFHLKHMFNDNILKYPLSLNLVESIGPNFTGGRAVKQGKKEILGKLRCIYKIPGSRKEHIKYKAIFITVTDYKRINTIN